MEPSEHRHDHDRLHDISDGQRLSRNSLADSLMWPGFIEVLLILADETTKMPIIKDDHVVENLSACTTKKSFRDGIQKTNRQRG
jgi:hypothetical protein